MSVDWWQNWYDKRALNLFGLYPKDSDSVQPTIRLYSVDLSQVDRANLASFDTFCCLLLLSPAQAARKIIFTGQFHY